MFAMKQEPGENLGRKGMVPQTGQPTPPDPGEHELERWARAAARYRCGEAPAWPARGDRRAFAHWLAEHDLS